MTQSGWLHADGGVERLVRLAHEHLGMDVAYVGEFTDGRQVYRALAGDAASFGMHLDDGPDLEGTYCARMVAGQIPNVIPNTASDSRVRELPATATAGIGAYVGVPLYLPDGQLYGTFCALSHERDVDVNSRDAKFLGMLAELAAVDLARDRALRIRHGELTGVLHEGSIETALQPVVDLVTGRCTSFEALARFPGSLGPPNVVFASANEVGLRLDLEALAISKAVALLPHLQPEQSLAVNVSPDVLLELLPRLQGDIPLDRLIVEVTEHSIVGDYARLRDQLRPLRGRGLRLAIDDAGAGYASLRHIIELRPDIIKIDRSLVAGIDLDPARRSAMTTFVLLALDTGASVVAEGVETRAELVAVAALGADAAQGYYLARPSTDVIEMAARYRGEVLVQ